MAKIMCPSRFLQEKKAKKQLWLIMEQINPGKMSKNKNYVRTDLFIKMSIKIFWDLVKWIFPGKLTQKIKK